MAPSAITEDYYMILGVDQAAGLELIIKSYKQLALKLHPDRNPERGATEAFQKLGRAYETLKDESERRKYDLIYPTLKGKVEPSHYTQKAYTTPGLTPQAASSNETAQIAAIQKSKQERAARWSIVNSSSESLMFEVKRLIRRLEQEIKGLDTISAAEAAVEARKNSWHAWFLSPIYKTPEESDEQKALKEIAKQERRMEKDMKERRLDAQREKLKAAEISTKTAKNEKDAADSRDEMFIRTLQNKIRMREDQQRRERERVERERVAQLMKKQQEQQAKRAREAAEAFRQEQAARRKAEQDKYDEEMKRWQKIAEEESKRQPDRYTYFDYAEASAPQTRTASCRHDGWWPKVQGRTACPECSESWTYLLQCPGCDMKACPRCQAAVRPRHPRNTRRTDRRRAPPRARTPSPNYGYGYGYDYDWD
ncbi:hypothetical protein DE146DRAFT_631121 [Phaeosphaeria sp. MPI-PUGE-AT-0046c]|nr:hypothetical protein DE146DRAFT_631121 [Phaeosphaeria sp. MPI-PUGE-AT-0046c]